MEEDRSKEKERPVIPQVPPIPYFVGNSIKGPECEYVIIGGQKAAVSGELPKRK